MSNLISKYLPKTESDYQALAQMRGIKWIDTAVPSNTNTKTMWECPQGHQWLATYSSTRISQNCPVCACVTTHEKLRKKPTDYHHLASSRSYTWLGPLPPNTGSKTWWMCEQGHQWEAKYDNIKSGTGCPSCAGTVPKQPLDYETLAQSRCIEWIGLSLPQNTDTRTRWRCPRNHEWETSYGNIKQGNSCPICANRVPKTAADYHTLAEKHHLEWLDHEVPRKVILKTLWRCQVGHQWQASYNSIHHGHGCPYCAGTVKKDETAYLTLAQQKGITWIGDLPQNTTYKTIWRCSKGHEWAASYISIKRNGCPHCSDHRKTSADYHQLAKDRNFEWLGPVVPTTRVKTYWRCQDGHEWAAKYAKIREGSGCPECARLARRKRNFQHFKTSTT